MRRFTKQLSFGSLYLGLLILVAGGIYFFYLKPVPSCFDSKQNQKETGIDCGGSCIPCELKRLQLTTEEVKFFPAGEGRVTLLAKVIDPSQNYGAHFTYRFELDAFQGSQPAELGGKSKISPQTTKYIVIPGAPFNYRDIRNADFKITDLNWDLTKEEQIYAVRLDTKTNVSDMGVTVTGIFSNDSALNLPVVFLTAILFDNQGRIISASTAKLEKINAFTESRFTIFFPKASELAKNIDSGRTQVFWESALND